MSQQQNNMQRYVTIMKRTSRGVFDKETLRDIGERIRTVRGDETQDEFAKKIGVGRTVLANYEAGRRLPDSDTLEKIADERGYSTSYLLTGIEAAADPFRIDTRYPDTPYQEGFAVALFIYEKMKNAFSSKPEIDRLMIWGHAIPKLAEHLDTVIGRNVSINDSDFSIELAALIEEFRETDPSDVLELIVELNATNNSQ
jgi:transcriptional regulator with XRE-family HTH domain